MPATVSHEYVSTKADPADATLVGKTKWNAAHVVALSVLPVELDLTSLTASRPLGTDDSKALVSLGVTGSGDVVLKTGAVLETPTLGVAVATSINKVAITAPATGAILTIADGVTLAAPANATVSGTNTGDQTTISGNAGSATVLQTSRNINGVAFNGSANITVPAAGSTLTDTVPVAKGGTGLTGLGTALHVLRVNAAGNALEFAAASGGGSGDVVGPASATDGVPALFDGTTGKLLKNSTPTGTGNPVLHTSPTLVTPNIGAATGTTLILSGLMTSPSLVLAATGFFAWGTTRSVMYSKANGNVTFYNFAETDFGLLQLGGVTSAFGAIGRDGAGVKVIAADGTTGAFLSFVEQPAPAPPAANGGRFFFQDNGSGKTQAMILFGSGAAQQVAIEP